MADGEDKNLGGRPRKEIDIEKLIRAAQIQCTADECAALFDCSPDTLDRRLKEEGYDGFADFYKIHSQNGKSSLRRLQWKSAQDGNVAMQIWLGKQMLGQKDKSENTNTNINVDAADLTEAELATIASRGSARAADKADSPAKPRKLH